MSRLIVFKGGRIAAPQGVRRADVLVDGKSGKILRISSHILSKGARAINCSGLILLPGAVDPHVHLRDPEDTTKEDFSTGTASALAGGVTTVIDMPCYRNPATTSLSAYNRKRAIAKRKCRCDYQIRFGASERSLAENIPHRHRKRAFLLIRSSSAPLRSFPERKANLHPRRGRLAHQG
jgi:dihydroorotase